MYVHVYFNHSRNINLFSNTSIRKSSLDRHLWKYVVLTCTLHIKILSLPCLTAPRWLPITAGTRGVLPKPSNGPTPFLLLTNLVEQALFSPFYEGRAQERTSDLSRATGPEKGERTELHQAVGSSSSPAGPHCWHTVCCVSGKHLFKSLRSPERKARKRKGIRMQFLPK